MIISQTRMITLSARPPKYPLAPPMSIPSEKVMVAHTIPIDREMREPNMMRLKRSRPYSSAPNRYTRAGASTVKRCRFVGMSPKSFQASSLSSLVERKRNG